MSGDLAWVDEVLSPARFARYVRICRGDRRAALRLYGWNIEAAAAFVHPLHYLEVAFRNALHVNLRAWAGVDDWWIRASLSPAGRRMLFVAEAGLDVRGRPVVPDDIVANLNFGFWVSLLDQRYHRTLWVPTLYRAFPKVARRNLQREYESVRLFRNRIAHHEPIHHRHLAADHATLRRLLGQLSPEALEHMSANDPVPGILAKRWR